MKASIASWTLLSPEGTYHELCEPNFFVGREDHMDLKLRSRSVDKQHAVISVNKETEEYILHDLGTLNGTFVNEMKVKQQPVNLQLRDNIRFGYDILWNL
ncbi:Centrosomal protein of 170 kDa protein B [Acropora cervicornis]|uniref:Centrosomal protein of 170 kDa protein B n=1 Tax=Acropora cervicornis TaxID=6130 RepID=A0AAD9QHD2_ACRCE|nr:Centrosomal protein of 170 kDa protein B [Acropora cervicornis]